MGNRGISVSPRPPTRTAYSRPNQALKRPELSRQRTFNCANLTIYVRRSMRRRRVLTQRQGSVLTWALAWPPSLTFLVLPLASCHRAQLLGLGGRTPAAAAASEASAAFFVSASWTRRICETRHPPCFATGSFFVGGSLFHRPAPAPGAKRVSSILSKRPKSFQKHLSLLQSTVV